jgi:hypothetical protein
MGKDPAVLFYTSDFLSGTAFFTKSQKGEYITLLCEQHQLWSIPENHLIEMCGSLDSPVVKKFIKDKDGTWYNLRMRTETIKRKKYSESRRKNIMNRYHENDKPLKNKRVKPPTYEGTSVLHMENENENRNDNINEYTAEFEKFWNLYPKKKSKGSAFKAWKKIKSPVETLMKISDALQWQKESIDWKKENGQYIPYPGSYLNGNMWEDEKLTDISNNNKPYERKL